jgi:hypothetical protein
MLRADQANIAFDSLYIYIAAVMCSESSNIGLVVLKSSGKCYARFTIYYYYTIDEDVTYCNVLLIR